MRVFQKAKAIKFSIDAIIAVIIGMEVKGGKKDDQVHLVHFGRVKGTHGVVAVIRSTFSCI